MRYAGGRALGLGANLNLEGGSGGWSVSNAGNARGGTHVGSKTNDSITSGTATDFLTGGLGDDVLAASWWMRGRIA